jgi:hypothetical protein
MKRNARLVVFGDVIKYIWKNSQMQEVVQQGNSVSNHLNGMTRKNAFPMS